jgi:hypothetical protein
MKNNFLMIMIFIFARLVNAQDCQGMRENDVQRLDNNGGPLVGARIQDQDGIGTCYANATSVALQTVLPGHPDVSYLQLAFAHAEIDKAPKNAPLGKDSAYILNADGSRVETLITGGHVCDTINAARNVKIGGVCLRDDVALEKVIFDSKTKKSRDSLLIQEKIVNAVSEYYESTKLNFGVRPGMAKEEIAKRVLAFNKYKYAFDNMVKEKQAQFTKEECLKKQDTVNTQKVLKNAMVRIYTYLTNKYGSARSPKIYEKGNPDSPLFFYAMRLGTVDNFADAELSASVDTKLIKSLEDSYLTELKSANPPRDPLVALRKTLLNIGGAENLKKFTPVVDRLIGDFSTDDKKQLDKDYDRYVNKNVSDCVEKNALLYFKNEQGFLKDFSANQCLNMYRSQGKNINKLVSVLDENNFSNIDSISAFMTKLPTMDYEQAMSAIMAPECSEDKKIKIPDNLSCENNFIDYQNFLENKLVAKGNITRDEIKRLIATEETSELEDVRRNYIDKQNTINAAYAGRTDAASLIKNADEIKKLEADQTIAQEIAKNNSKIKICKQLVGADEPRLWNEYYSANKSKFSSNVIDLLKNAKQAVPVSICTGMFKEPNATAVRDGSCEKSATDGSYKDVGGHHAVVVIGVRCQKGKLNYLIQNSWGEFPQSKIAKNSDGSQHFESEFGKAWLDEDELMNNNFGFQKILMSGH